MIKKDLYKLLSRKNKKLFKYLIVFVILMLGLISTIIIQKKSSLDIRSSAKTNNKCLDHKKTHKLCRGEADGFIPEKYRYGNRKKCVMNKKGFCQLKNIANEGENWVSKFDICPGPYGEDRTGWLGLPMNYPLYDLKNKLIGGKKCSLPALKNDYQYCPPGVEAKVLLPNQLYKCP